MPLRNGIVERAVVREYCSVGGRLKRRSASMSVLVGAWRKAMSCRSV